MCSRKEASVLLHVRARAHTHTCTHTTHPAPLSFQVHIPINPWALKNQPQHPMSPETQPLSPQTASPPPLAPPASKAYFRPPLQHAGPATPCAFTTQRSSRPAPALGIKTNPPQPILSTSSHRLLFRVRQQAPPNEAPARPRQLGRAPCRSPDSPISPDGPRTQADKVPTAPRRSSLTAPGHSNHSRWEPPETSLLRGSPALLPGLSPLAECPPLCLPKLTPVDTHGGAARERD